MRRLGRRAAIGATGIALIYAGAGTSLGTVRSIRSVGGAIPSTRAAPDRGVASNQPDVARKPPGGGGNPAPAGTPANAGPGAPAGPGAAQRLPAVAVPPVAPVGVSTSTAGSAGGPPGAGCPADSGLGALPSRNGRLEAVKFTLPRPDSGPVVLLLQPSAARTAGANVRISRASAGVLAADGTGITVPGALSVSYTLVAGDETAEGTIDFTAKPQVMNVAARACRDQSFVLHDVGRAALDGSPLRIVGVVAPPGTVIVGENGGTAHFRSASPGTYQVTILTATDAGTAGPLVSATVTVP